MPNWESTSAMEHAIVYCVTGGAVSVPFVALIVLLSGRLEVIAGFLWAFALLVLLFDQIDALVAIRLDRHDGTETTSRPDRTRDDPERAGDESTEDSPLGA